MITVKRSFACGLGLALALASGAGIAQTNQTFRTQQVVSGKPARLGFVSTLGKDCNPVPLGDIRVKTPPKTGSLAIREGKVKSSRCANKEMNVKFVMYEAPAKYTGDDQVVLEVKHSDGRLEAMTIRIEVRNQQPSTPGSTQKKETKEL
jgi:hypothetical protein